MEGSSYAWGPEREVFKDRAGYAVLNSVVNMPGVGDERNFVRVRRAGTLDAWTDYVEVADGGRYEVYIYFRNDAEAAALEGVRAQSYFGKYVSGEADAVVMGALRADGAEMIWDSARFVTAEGALELRYVAGSARLHNMGAANGAEMEGIFRYPGAELGYDILNGVLVGGAEHAGYISYEVEAVAAKAVRKGEIVGEALTAVIQGVAEEGSAVSAEAAPAEAGIVEGEMPTTGASGGVALAVIMGAVVALGWSLLRKIGKYGKIDEY